MTTFERIELELKSRNILPATMSKDLGFSSGLFSQWRSGQNPSTEKIHKVAEYLNVSVDYLLGNEDHSVEDTVKTYLFGTTNVDDDIFNQVKQYAKFIYQERTSARIAASGGGKISVSSSKKTKEELDRLEAAQNSRKEADEIKKKLKK